MSFLAECTFYDLKQMLERKKVKSWLKSVSAFANTEGGSLFFGVDDSHTVVGLQDVQSDADFISECINDKLDPVPEYQHLPLQVEGKPVLELRIQDLTAALPTYTDSKLPTFASDGFTFYTTVGNVNYDPNKVNDTQNVGDNVGSIQLIELTERQRVILELISSDSTLLEKLMEFDGIRVYRYK